MAGFVRQRERRHRFAGFGTDFAAIQRREAIDQIVIGSGEIGPELAAFLAIGRQFISKGFGIGCRPSGRRRVCQIRLIGLRRPLRWRALGIHRGRKQRAIEAMPAVGIRKQSTALPHILLVDHAHMRRDHVPTVGKPHPALHLPSDDLAPHALVVKQCRGHGEGAAGWSPRSGDGAVQACRRARGAERGDLAEAVEDFRAAVADGARIDAESVVEHRDVFVIERLF